MARHGVLLSEATVSMYNQPAHDGAALLVAPLLWVVVGSEVLLITYCACALSTTAPVDGEAAPALLGPAHGGEQQDVEDDEGDAGEHLNEYYTEPAGNNCMEERARVWGVDHYWSISTENILIFCNSGRK